MAENSSSSEPTGSIVIDQNGVCFETLVPEPVLLIPENKPGAETPVKFGIRMTNQTQKSLRFCGYRTFYPNLIEPNGKHLRVDGGSEASRSMLKSECPLVEPGESVAFFLDGKLTWKNYKIYLEGRRECGEVWYFINDIKPGRYSLYFSYNNSLEKRRIYDPEKKILENIWTGQVETPLVEIYFVLPPD